MDKMAFTAVQTERGELRILENCDEVAIALAEYIAELSEHFAKERGFFAIALSGGSLIGLLGKLCELPFIKTVEWSKWHIFWADEHLVARTHVDSNFRLARDGFLFKIPVAPSHVYPVNDLVSAEEAANQYEFLIRQSVKVRTINVSAVSDNPKFDLILLGMGPDGHIASLFPNHAVLDPDNTDWVSYMIDSPKSPPERVTFTLPVINAAENVAIVVTGEGKAEAVHLAIDNVEPDSPSLPARMVQPAQGKLVWFLDKPAASKLTVVPKPSNTIDSDQPSEGSSIFP